MILLEKRAAKLHLPLNRSFRKRPENINVRGRSRQNTQVTFVTQQCFTVLFFLVLLRKLTNVVRTYQHVHHDNWHSENKYDE